MKKILLPVAFVIFWQLANAQQGFGTSAPDRSAIIDMVNANPSINAKGVLMPRVALKSITDIVTVPSPANTLTVFNTATTAAGTNDVTPGYYYWNINKWIRILTAADTQVSNASSINTATVTVNGITSIGAPIVNTNINSLTGTSLTTAVNGVASTSLNLQPAITAGTTHALSSAVNTITSVVNGISVTAPAVNSNALTLAGTSLTSNINGVASTALNLQPAITAGTTHALTNPLNTITSVVNGISVTAPVVNSVSNTSNNNNLSTTVNGITGTAVPIVNTNTTSLTGTSLTTAVNGVTSTSLNLQPAITAGTTHALSSAVNTITSVVNGISVTAPAVNSNTLTAANGNLVSTVNGVATTPAVPVLISASNGLTATNGDVKLGGNLSAATTINQAGNALTFTGTAVSLVKITNTTGTLAAPVSALQITDGSQALGKVLTSDANGNTSWTYSALKAIPGTLPSGAAVSSFTSYGAGTPPNTSLYTGGSIVLPPGKWMVVFGSLASMGLNDRINTSDAQLWCTAFLSNSTTSNVTTPDFIVSYTGQRGSGGSIGRGMNRTMVAGAIAINNTSGADKTYYLWANQELEVYPGGPQQIFINGGTTLGTNPGYWVNVFGNGNFERYFYAIPIQ